MNDIVLICRKPGFRRNGIAHEARKVWPADRWTDDELRAFDTDPMFEVQDAGEALAAPKEPDEPEGKEREDAIDLAMMELEAKHFGTEGQPNVRVLKDILGFLPDAPEIEAACHRLSEGDDPMRFGRGVRTLALKAVTLSAGDFTREGRPKVAALEKAVGFKPTAEEIDAGWRSGSAAGS